MIDVACLIIGIDGWEQYTAPLVHSLRRHEPEARLVVIDNASETPYPLQPYIHRTQRLSYAAAINRAHWIAGEADWYVVLSNDVVCTGSFAGKLETLGDVVAGPFIRVNMGYQYVEGWCVCANSRVWNAVGGWDNEFIMSSWEDVDFSVSAVEKGFKLEWQPLPFKHLDQRQRFGLPNYGGSEGHNYSRMQQKHPLRVAL